ncbi:FAD-binding oxidoreductase [Massilia sp. R2A-15]|uniref:FAD-binding oxidoreductase n=1 Tax=Massilia sp. R2A-15 TaxID=3064278 RepID=UPI002734A5E5|nr:FAD-binding oxidoreductase [Massilia sp. R2A-15]WLI90828.1 FAD-binding oxidoreductase [Massilia sp. R2A-15]
MDTVTSDQVNDFRTKLRGSILSPGDAGYDSARQIWNAMIDKRPAMIVRCAGPADVLAAVNFARDSKLPLAVRGGGHNIAGSALCDDGLVIDLSAMRSVQIDPTKRRAYVEGGATLRDFDHEAQAYGLATPLGINSTTGVAGLTLGGGFGWLSRKYGLAVDNLISADIVTADGRRLHISETHEPDLFWAIRGGGGNFGVVTNFEFALHPVGPEVTAGLIVFPLAQAKSILKQYRELVDTMGDDVSVWVVLRKAPPLPFLPGEWHGKEILALALFSPKKTDELQGVIDKVRGFGQPVGEHVGAVPYAAWQQAFDPLLAPGARNYWKSHNFERLTDDAIDVIVDYAGKLPSPNCEIFLGLIGGQASVPSATATAYPHRSALWAMNVHTRWEDPAEDSTCITWAREFFKMSAPYASGSVYINFLTADESDRIADAYGPNYARLEAIKAKYDPQNLFRANQNIRPAAP